MKDFLIHANLYIYAKLVAATISFFGLAGCSDPSVLDFADPIKTATASVSLPTVQSHAKPVLIETPAPATDSKLADALERQTAVLDRLDTTIQSQSKMLESMETRSKAAMAKLKHEDGESDPVLEALQNLNQRIEGLDKQQAAPPTMKKLWFFCKAHCDPCKDGEVALRKYGYFDLIVNHDESTHPDYVKRYGAEFGYPVSVWENSTGVHLMSGFTDIGTWVKDYNKLSSGKKAASRASSAQERSPNPSLAAFYPIHGNWWTGCGSWRHLTQGEHAGKFDPAWLQSLSYSEIQSLHSDDHDGRVKWQYVVRPGQYQQMACEKKGIPVKLVGYQPSPPAPSPNDAPPAPAEPRKLMDSQGTEWQESPPTVRSKRFYSVGPPVVSSDPIVIDDPFLDPVGGWRRVRTTVVGNPPWWNNWFWHRFRATGPVTYSTINTYSGSVMYQTRASARREARHARRAARHAARAAAAPTYRAFRPFRVVRLGLCPTC